MLYRDGMVEDMDCISMYIVTNKVPMQECLSFVGLHIFEERNLCVEMRRATYSYR